MRMYSGNAGSAGGKALSEALGISRIKHEGSKYKPKAGDVILNWGALQFPQSLLVQGVTIINHPSHLQVTSDKLKFFQHMSQHAADIIPQWTASKQEAEGWIRSDSSTVVCRTILNGSSGKGIVIAKSPTELVNAPLYVRYIPKKDEFRIHIFRHNIIDMQQKARRMEVQSPNWQVRNHENGFIYKRNDIAVPECVKKVALTCMSHLPMDFGAVDVIYNSEKKKAYVLEVNSAPGLEGTTVTKYAEAFKPLL